ncbi:MAG: hypothetical protein ACF8PN_11795 [Phycisphaerales bacterium]
MSERIVVSESSLRSLRRIRHDWVLRERFGRVLVATATAENLRDDIEEWPDWIERRTPGAVELPPRLVRVEGSDRDTLMLAIEEEATLTLIEGKALLEKVKLSYIKSMGIIPLLVEAWRDGEVRSIKPLLVALERAGHDMPPPEQMDALRLAIDELG